MTKSRKNFRIICILLVAILLLGVTGCQVEKGDEPISDTNTTQSGDVLNTNANTTQNENTSEVSINATESGNVYKEDYLQACSLISGNYIYLERKLNKTRQQFLDECVAYADTVDWSKGESQFIHEIKMLRSKFHDGHFDWSLNDDLRSTDTKYLGFTATIGSDNKVYVAKVYPAFTDQLSVGDEIIKWSGEEVANEIERLGQLLPKSTNAATNESAARRLSIEFSFQPVRDELEPVLITYKDNDGNMSELKLEWKKCAGTIDWEDVVLNGNGQDNSVLATRSLEPSLEEIPADTQFIHPSLLYYIRDIDDQKYAIFHPRDFYNWDMSDLDETFKLILNENPNILVVDLKDSAGGAFNQVLYLSYILNVQDNFKFFYDFIDSKTQLRLTGIDNFDFITDEIRLDNVWEGEVVFRINPLTCSAGDFFSRRMQMSERGLIIGLPSAGAGGGTDTYTLDNTKTEISFPSRERIIMGDEKSLEGNSVVPDYLYDGDLIDYLRELY